MTMHRFQTDMTTAAVAEVDRIKEQTGAVSRAEVFRRALSVYKLVSDSIAAGRTIEIVSEDGTRERIVIV